MEVSTHLWQVCDGNVPDKEIKACAAVGRMHGEGAPCLDAGGRLWDQTYRSSWRLKKVRHLAPCGRPQTDEVSPTDFLDGPVWIQDLMIFMGPFQLRIFYDSKSTKTEGGGCFWMQSSHTHSTLSFF